MRTIHFLHEGLPLCGFTREIPINWPHQHKWAHRGDEEALSSPMMCNRCAAVFRGEHVDEQPLIKVRKLHEAGHEEALYGMSLSHGLHKKEMSPEERQARKLDRAKRLAHQQGGHNKFLEHMAVWFEVRAPRYWWQQADTYRIASKQSESTMHTILHRHLVPDDFIDPPPQSWIEDLNAEIDGGNLDRVKRWLPEGFLQTREWLLSYKTIQNIWSQRKTHKLVEWHEFLARVLEQIEHPGYITGYAGVG